MKSLYFLLISFLLNDSPFAHDFELTFYGLIKCDAVYSSEGVLTFGNPNLSALQVAKGVDEAALGFTANNQELV